MNIPKSDLFTTLDVENDPAEMDSDDDGQKSLLDNSNYFSIDITVPCPTEGRFFCTFLKCIDKKVKSEIVIIGLTSLSSDIPE